MKLVITTYNSTEDVINNLQELKGKTKLIFLENISSSYDNMIIGFHEDPFAKNAECISKVYHEVLLLMKFLQTKPQVKNMNFNYYDLYYTVIKIRKEKEVVDNQYENHIISLNDVIIPNHNVGIKGRKMRSWINHFK